MCASQERNLLLHYFNILHYIIFYILKLIIFSTVTPGRTEGTKLAYTFIDTSQHNNNLITFSTIMSKKERLARRVGAVVLLE